MSKHIETDANTCCQWLPNTHYMRSKSLSITHRPLTLPPRTVLRHLLLSQSHLSASCISLLTPQSSRRSTDSFFPSGTPLFQCWGTCPLALQDDAPPIPGKQQVPVATALPQSRATAFTCGKVNVDVRRGNINSTS